MQQIRVAVCALVLFHLLSGAEQQACPGQLWNVICDPPGATCTSDLSAAVTAAAEGHIITLLQPGTYRLLQPFNLSRSGAVTCIVGNTSDAGSYILQLVPSGAVHFQFQGNDITLSLEGLTVRGDTALTNGGISMPTQGCKLFLSSVMYQDNAQGIDTAGPGNLLSFTDTSFIGNNRAAPGGVISAAEDSGVAPTTITFGGNNK